MMRKIFSDRFALMRHAQTENKNGQEVISLRSIEVCIESAERLADHLNGRSVVIFHSPQKRALLTAKVFGEALEQGGTRVESITTLSWLDVNMRELSEENIRTVLPEDPRVFAVFITHYGEISDFLDWTDDPHRIMPNCAIYAREFRI